MRILPLSSTDPSLAAAAVPKPRRLIGPHTDVSLGNCSFLDGCRQRHCKYIHYQLDPDNDLATPSADADGKGKQPGVPAYLAAMPEGQQISCDVRSFDMTLLGKFGVIMADPPWQVRPPCMCTLGCLRQC